MASFKSAFTVDVEDGVSIAMRDVFQKNVPQTQRVLTNTEKILDILEEQNVKGTFFILGQVARDFPALIRKTAAAGHEIAVHGYDHLVFTKMTPEKAYSELSSAKKLLEDISGCEVKGHRAPAFSVTPRTAWALDVIAEAGFSYDSSIMPLSLSNYGWPSFPKEIVKIRTSAGNEILEAPISSVRFLNRHLPFSGGGYLRLLPYGLTKMAFGKVTKSQPAILYIHPYELDTERYPDYFFESFGKISKLRQLKMRSNWVSRSTVAPKLVSLLKSYSFTTMNEICERIANLPANWYADTASGSIRKLD